MLKRDMSFSLPAEFTEIAHALADVARPIALKYFRSETLSIEHKEDNTPVTRADREIETAMREILGAKRPQDGILGEEHGHENAEAEYQWILDPIDGTRAFTTGRTNFGTLIALYHQTHGFVLGLCDQAVTQDRWISLKGGKTIWNGREVKTRNVKDLSEAIFACTDPLRLPPRIFELVKIIRAESKMNVFGGDCLNYGLLAGGFIDVIVEGRQELHDIASFVPIIENAGGKITQLSGAPIGFVNDDRVVAASSPELHAHILELFQKIP